MNGGSMFLKRIKDTRTDKDFSQKYMSEKLKVPRTTYASWENGDNKISLLFFIKTCLELNVSLDYVLELKDESKRLFNVNELDLKIIATNIVNLLKANKLSQKQFALNLNLSESMISHIVHARVPISLENIYTLAKKYGFSVDEFCYKIIDFKNGTIKED